ncbi:tripartite tricarboxylate transporter substrate binding protein [Ideonella azotifigens]|nr:tripartite tricarboxylate transporter substrate binding protein [Ideonella azotifigens]MCD2341823.1 tripartite tricarboxylate transporter substrate binding protein [Ideonella azotifigens]
MLLNPPQKAPGFALRRMGRLALAGALALLAFGIQPAAAQPDTWPARPLRLIVPFPPGGAADVIARAVAAKLGERLGQSVVVENRPGAGTIVAAQAAAQAAPDGYTLSLATNGQLAINPALHAKLPYDPVKSFAPVGLVASTAFIIAVNAASPIQTLPQLIAEAKRQPGALAFTSCGNGTTCHLTGELLKAQAGVDMLHVPFAGSVQAVTALLGNQVQVASDTVAILAPQIRAGKLRGLVVTSAQRSPVTPDVPSATEVGLPDLLAESWFGIVVPAATPPELVLRLNRELAAITQGSDVRDQFARLGVEPLQSTPEQFAKLIDSDIVKWGRVVRTAKVTAQ